MKKCMFTISIIFPFMSESNEKETLIVPVSVWYANPHPYTTGICTYT